MVQFHKNPRSNYDCVLMWCIRLTISIITYRLFPTASISQLSHHVFSEFKVQAFPTLSTIKS